MKGATPFALMCEIEGLNTDDVHSVNSIDEMLTPDNNEQSMDAWRAELADRIEELIDRKRSSVQGREKCLTIFIRILTNQYAEEEIRGREAELVAAFLKSIKAESSEKETVLAIKGMYRNQYLLKAIKLNQLHSSRHDSYDLTLGCDLRHCINTPQKHHLRLAISG